jgi:lipid-A-disaccharide synthase
VLQGRTHEAIKVSDLALAVSGTVTLEAAILGTPAIVVYRVSKLSETVGRTLIKSHHVGLINILAGETLMPELIQDDARPAHIAHTAQDMLSDPDRMSRLRERLGRAAATLGGPGAAARAAELAVSLIE